MGEIVIRQYRKEDRSSVRAIAWNTAFMGEPAERFCDAEEFLASCLTEYFTDYEPESCFVAESDNMVIGYLTGAKDRVIVARIFQAKIARRLLMQAIIGGILLKKKNRDFIFHSLVSFFRREFVMPDFIKDYPAILHINLEKNWRGLKAGSRLMVAYLDYLARAKVAGVYLATLSGAAAEFFGGQGFNLLYKGKRSYFRYLLHENTPIYIYGKKL